MHYLLEEAGILASLKALKDTGYSGIHTSLANKTWDSALSSIRDWNQRIEDNPDIFLRALVSSPLPSS